MTRTWSIRARTAVVFALASMVLTAGVLVFVNLASSASFARALETDGTADGIHLVRPADPGRPAAQPVHGDVEIVTAAKHQQWKWSVAGIGAAGLLAGGVGWLVSRRMLAPVDRITATARRISADNLHERIALDGPDDELRRLSGTIDDLLGRLQTAFESQRRFVAHASHELRTPLAVQRAAIQIGLHDPTDHRAVAAARDDLLDQNRRTEHLVESLLVLAEADRELEDLLEDVDLPAVVQEVGQEFTAAADAAGVTVTCATRAEPPGRLRGEPTLVRQLLRNLVDNAIEYNVPGGWVHLLVDDRGVLVENTGHVVAVDDVSALTEPFCRGGDRGSRRHSGLGLAIVVAVARAHGWAVVPAHRVGGGLTVRVDVSSV